MFVGVNGKSRSEDNRTRVGGVALDKSGRVLGVSYNGLSSGKIMPDWLMLEENRDIKGDLMIHCESNLFSQIKRRDCHTICLTISPCIKCCQNIAALEVKKVVYIKEYNRCGKFKQFLDFHEIEYRQLDDTEKKNLRYYISDLNNFNELD